VPANRLSSVIREAGKFRIPCGMEPPYELASERAMGSSWATSAEGRFLPVSGKANVHMRRIVRWGK